MTARIPQRGTLRRYGMTALDWLLVLKRQGGVCAVCRKLPANGRLCVDHDHVKGWKKMSAADRKRHVRGLLCFWCNSRYVGRSITLEKAENVVNYLRSHAERAGQFLR